MFGEDGGADYAVAQAMFKAEVRDKASEVDPGNERDWLSLTQGWALGKGFKVEEAIDFAIHIRYGTDLG